eukprot:g11145.t1
MVEQKKQEAEKAKKEVAQFEEKKKFFVSQAQEITKKKINFTTQAVERKAPVPPDGRSGRDEQKLLAKEKRYKMRIEERSAQEFHVSLSQQKQQLLRLCAEHQLAWQATLNQAFAKLERSSGTNKSAPGSPRGVAAKGDSQTALSSLISRQEAVTEKLESQESLAASSPERRVHGGFGPREREDLTEPDEHDWP